MGRKVTALISKKALKHNLLQVRQRCPHAKVMAMVKANAYGHDLLTVAQIFSEPEGAVDALGVASIEEALFLRTNGIQTDIVLMEGIAEEELPLAQIHRFTLVVHHFPQIQSLLNYNGLCPQPFKIWLKINTGMNRLGFEPDAFNDAWGAIVQDPRIELIGFMTHFAEADNLESDCTQKQSQRFEKMLESREGLRSLANSAGILAWPQMHADWVRPGLILYGASPFSSSMGQDFNLIPAMTLSSKIIALRDLQKGECVGYGSTWKNPYSEGRIAIVAVGYGDGYPWHAQNGTPVLINGKRASTVGRVSMDMLAVDITHIGLVNVGDPVILWGKDLPIEEVARSAGSLPYELFCKLTKRVDLIQTD